MTVYFVGSGPGDPDLLTLKGERLLKEADLIVYAGSLVNPELLGKAKQGCRVLDSSGMHLEQICSEMIGCSAKGELVVRLQSGDPSIFGALREQMKYLTDAGVEYEMVPGVSSFSAAAAAVVKEYTLPEISQTIILTRLAGRTPVPAEQALGELAAHKASMAIFLSINMIDNVVNELKKGYADTTPVAVVYKASWPQEKVIEGTVGDIAKKVKAAGLKLSALILVGDFLGDPISASRLYDRSFSHGFREGEK